eukprot:751023-Hanusia_phi.AAC.2
MKRTGAALCRRNLGQQKSHAPPAAAPAAAAPPPPPPPRAPPPRAPVHSRFFVHRQCEDGAVIVDRHCSCSGIREIREGGTRRKANGRGGGGREKGGGGGGSEYRTGTGGSSAGLRSRERVCC